MQLTAEALKRKGLGALKTKQVKPGEVIALNKRMEEAIRLTALRLQKKRRIEEIDFRCVKNKQLPFTNTQNEGILRKNDADDESHSRRGKVTIIDDFDDDDAD